MNVFVEILEEIEQLRRKAAENGNFNVAAVHEKDMNIIRKHMIRNSGTFAFDFTSVNWFECSCGQHYVHIERPPEIEFCPECKEKVANDETDLCPECLRKLYEYEEKYHCIVDIGMKGPTGDPGYPG